MSPLRQIFELTKRDFTQRAKSRAFLMAMVLTVGIVVIIGPIIAFHAPQGQGLPEVGP